MTFIKFVSLMLAIFFTLAGCSSEGNLIEGSSKIEAGKGEVVNSHGRIQGLENIEQFYENTTNKIASKLKVVHYTIEGDPIYINLSYDGVTISVEHDTTQDQFGSGNITTTSCDKFFKEENPTNLSYVASECNGNELGMEEVLYVTYDMKQQDLFELQLKYGKDLENEINTIDKKLTKVISEDETMNIADFDLSTAIKQEVYKRLVLANYLEIDSLENQCNENDSEKYNLKVNINGGSREFSWGHCNDSEVGKNMTDIAEYIIASTENTEESANSAEKIQGYVLDVKENEILIREELTAFDYETLKDISISELMENYNLRLITLRGVHTDEIKKGEKISAVITGQINESSKPGTATVIEIKKINID